MTSRDKSAPRVSEARRGKEPVWRLARMDSSTFREDAREWAEAIAGTLGAAAFVVGGVGLPGVLDAVCPFAVDVLGGLACLAFFVGGPVWLLTRK